MKNTILASLIASGIVLGASFIGASADFGKNLTEEELASIETMTEDEKEVFLTAKKEEVKAEREAKAAVIDALLANETLTAEQETLRQEIITERAERKEQRAQMEAIKAKLEAGEELTDAEQEVLDSKKGKRGGRGHGKAGMRGGIELR